MGRAIAAACLWLIGVAGASLGCTPWFYVPVAFGATLAVLTIDVLLDRIKELQRRLDKLRKTKE